jgi:hypothetical protein
MIRIMIKSFSNLHAKICHISHSLLLICSNSALLSIVSLCWFEIYRRLANSNKEKPVSYLHIILELPDGTRGMMKGNPRVVELDHA